MEYKGLSLFYIYLLYIFDFIIYIISAYFLQNYFNSGLPLLKFLKKCFSLNTNLRNINDRNINKDNLKKENSNEICKKKYKINIK
jgi:hypothetical protein